ncbi:ribosome silencing factor [Frischella sp. Ac48]|uniref:Ribosomal silencing factor RsfS n=1 Tax=Frischella japonica TaxID=2741544 RepID=A0ABR7QXZ9_9GAMM|nr:ribosome silencing factor [Frischella japonica]MBX4132051.1 ribosome silencing factor [Frischella sp. Ac48]
MLQQSLQDFIIDKIDDLKGKDIVILDVKGKSSITDYMIICTGTSNRHVSSIANHLLEEAKKQDYLVLGSEGQNDADWVVVDLDSVMVHIMQEDSRQLYELEKLWSK